MFRPALLGAPILLIVLLLRGAAPSAAPATTTTAATTTTIAAPKAEPAPASPHEGVAVANDGGKAIFAGACQGCHGWTGESPVLKYASLTGGRL